ncbi:MAG: MFS transporter [Gammaproteobacteria bacterium]|jgi:predicted MFS family arabinose efflux permease|nr:MFS transporter [Gammaproteobacteria bacterium]MBU0828243.1 MFS transporter [Gammaproteobacteria bacterium]MBU0890819.1 MFS transporter [Gammaproteobacteria bacterium]MBU1351596.1 MFS transporter [Gammaproteobacteria bacterium]MBU1818742.1 MFS transporter [Gammaproteobacteria bacterium]
MHINTPKLSMFQVLACGAAIVTLSMGIRHGFGLWLLPITQEMGWTRQSFALAIAIQNLSWGLIGIFAGMVADRFGAFRVLMGGAVLYGLGLAGMALSTTPLVFALTAGVLIGAAQAGTTYAVIYGVLGRQIAPERRSWAMGVAAAAGSFGQFLMVPVEGWLIAGLGWQQALLALSMMVLLIVPLAFGLREPGFKGAAPVKREQTIVQALGEAFRYPSFNLLMAGYFVCGFQVVFIGVHMPSYLKDHGLSPQVASYALALIGLFNVFGTYIAGTLGQRVPKRFILAFIYFARAIAISVFLIVPLSPLSVYVFSAVMGTLWLSTIPPTNATIAQIFGVQHLSMLGGFVFFSHQIGSFLGVWLGGYLYDATGSYDIVWYIAIGLGVFAGLVNLPVKESPIQRHAPQPA